MLVPDVIAAAEIAIADMALRACFARECASGPEVHAMEWRITHESPGFVVVEMTVFDAQGTPIGGSSW